MSRRQRSEAQSGVRTNIIVAGVTSAAVLCGVGLGLTDGRFSVRDFAFFWVLYGVSLLDRVEVSVERPALVRNRAPRSVGLSPGFVVLLTAAFATSPLTAFAVAAVPPVAVLTDPEQRRPSRLIFNVSQEALYTGAAAMVFQLLRDPSDGAPVAFLAAGASGIVALALNTFAVGAVVAAERGISFADVLRRMTWTLPHSIGFSLIALMIATLYAGHGLLAAGFFVLPLAALRIARRAKLQLDHVRSETVLEFVRRVEDKDPSTFQHSERVAAIAVELHRELGATRKEIEKRWTAALLHDVGKVAVPGEVLRKPGPLTEDEFAFITKHPQIGAEAVERIDLFKELAPEIVAHHERLDGAGYPYGLKGDDIPWEARVLAVADAFEAMTSDRTYRRALSGQEALVVLRASAGHHHEPAAVEALARVLGRNLAFMRTAQLDVATETHASSR